MTSTRCETDLLRRLAETPFARPAGPGGPVRLVPGRSLRRYG